MSTNEGFEGQTEPPAEVSPPGPVQAQSKGLGASVCRPLHAAYERYQAWLVGDPNWETLEAALANEIVILDWTPSSLSEVQVMLTVLAHNLETGIRADRRDWRAVGAINAFLGTLVQRS